MSVKSVIIAIISKFIYVSSHLYATMASALKKKTKKNKEFFYKLTCWVCSNFFNISSAPPTSSINSVRFSSVCCDKQNKLQLNTSNFFLKTHQISN